MFSRTFVSIFLDFPETRSKNTIIQTWESRQPSEISGDCLPYTVTTFQPEIAFRILPVLP